MKKLIIGLSLALPVWAQAQESLDQLKTAAEAAGARHWADNTSTRPDLVVSAPRSQAAQEAGEAPRQSQDVPSASGVPNIVIQNQNVNNNSLNADKASGASKSMWMALGIGAGVGGGIGSIAGGVGAGVGAVIGALVALVVWFWLKQ